MHSGDTGGGNEVAKAFGLTLLRIFAVAPITLLGLALTLTFIGAPLGIPLMAVTSHWATKPLRQLPHLNPKGDSE